MGVDCTIMGSSLEIIARGSPFCIPSSCVPDWESGKDQLLNNDNADEMVKEMETMFSEILASQGIDSGDAECKLNSLSIFGSSVGAGEGSAVGSSAGEATTGAGEASVVGSSIAVEPTGAGAAESLAVGSSAGKATGMLALAATFAAAALFFF
jgi:hypothetical protein